MDPAVRRDPYRRLGYPADLQREAARTVADRLERQLLEVEAQRPTSHPRPPAPMANLKKKKSPQVATRGPAQVHYKRVI